MLASLDGTVDGISRRNGGDVRNVLRAGTVVLGDQSNADVALLLDLQAEQGVPRCQVFDTSRRFGMGGHVLERRAALGGPSKQLGGAFEGVEDGEHFDARVVL